MAKWYPREFASIDQALIEIVRALGDENIKQITGKTGDYFRKCTNPKVASQIYHKDSIQIDIESLRAGHGHPMLSAHQAQINKFIKETNQQIDVQDSLLSMSARLGFLVDATQRAMNPDSPSGSKIDMQEQDEIYKKITDLEKKLSDLKVAIGIVDN
ncbi:hypothetical protein OAD84_01045 [Pelagibacterales bacterium]|nr:hypothetical protein [Pelagibacterales bacterium]